MKWPNSNDGFFISHNIKDFVTQHKTVMLPAPYIFPLTPYNFNEFWKYPYFFFHLTDFIFVKMYLRIPFS